MKFSIFRIRWRRTSEKQKSVSERDFKPLPKKLKDLDESYRMLIRELGKR